MNLLRICAVLIVVFSSAVVVGAATAKEVGLGTFKDWEAYTFQEHKKNACAIWSKASQSKGKYKRRGDVMLFVTHRPGAKRRNEVSFETGYTFKQDSEVTVTIDAKKNFKLFTEAETAWSYSAKDDAALVKAMRVGQTMTIKGESKRGTKTVDTFKLLGFTAAHNAINKACKVN